jgi:ketosteroid isomerase-like protein
VRPVPRWFRGGSGSRARQIVAGSIVAAAALVAAMLGPSASADTADAAQKEIRAALEKWQSAFNHRDEQQVCDIFARDVVANYDGEPERDYISLCQMLQTALQDEEKTYRYSLRINDIMVYGETAVARLVWSLEIDNAGDAKEIIEEPSVDIFRRQADGNWKISRYLAYPSSR